MGNRSLKRLAALFAASFLFALLVPASAWAHLSHPGFTDCSANVCISAATVPVQIGPHCDDDGIPFDDDHVWLPDPSDDEMNEDAGQPCGDEAEIVIDVDDFISSEGLVIRGDVRRQIIPVSSAEDRDKRPFRIDQYD